jgi:hypothetical protein
MYPTAAKSPQHSKQGMSGSSLGKKPLASFVSFLFFCFSFPNKQKTELQSELKTVTSWNPSLWKTSLCHPISLPTAGSKPACMELQKLQVSITHYTWFPNLQPHSAKIIQCSPWETEIPPNKTEGSKQQTAI